MMIQPRRGGLIQVSFGNMKSCRRWLKPLISYFLLGSVRARLDCRGIVVIIHIASFANTDYDGVSSEILFTRRERCRHRCTDFRL